MAAQLQAVLEQLFCPPLDSALVAAIAHEPQQTLQSAKELCQTLATAAQHHEQQQQQQNIDAASSSTQLDTPWTTIRKPSNSQRRRNFGSKLTVASPVSVSSSFSNSSTPCYLSSTCSSCQNNGTDTPTSSVSDDGSIQRLLEEWNLYESFVQDPENLRLTNDEQDGQNGHPNDDLSHDEQITPADELNPLMFLQHAFPSRSKTFLAGMLSDSRDDIETVIDTIMTIEMIEAQDTMQQAAEFEQSDRQRVESKGLDYEQLAVGNVETALKGKKHKSARKRLQEEQKRAQGLLKIPNRNADQSKTSKIKVSLTEVRQGAPVNIPLHPYKQVPSSSVPLTDAELAAKLDAQERAQAAESALDEPITDNAWLLTSSVLSQLSTLLGVESSKVSCIFHQASFNLGVTFARVVDWASDRYPTLTALEDAGNVPLGAAQSICDGIAALTQTNTDQASKALRAAKGRQDAAIDLLELDQIVRTANGANLPDVLDPLARLTLPGDAEVIVPRIHKAEVVGGKSVSNPISPSSVQLEQQQQQLASPTLWQTVSKDKRSKAIPSAPSNKYSQVVGRNEVNSPTTGAKAAFLSGTTIGTVVPASSASMVPQKHTWNDDPMLNGAAETGFSSHIPTHDRMQRATRYRMISDEYRARRDQALRKAASTWRSSGGSARLAGKGGIAWHYADEARTLDTKSRAWSFKASEALVEDRRKDQVASRNTIDLHGVTIHEALLIVRQQLTTWYSTPSTQLVPFQIITGAGKHSPHQISRLGPAIFKMLQKEGWKYQVDSHRGMITVGGVK